MWQHLKPVASVARAAREVLFTESFFRALMPIKMISPASLFTIRQGKGQVETSLSLEFEVTCKEWLGSWWVATGAAAAVWAESVAQLFLGRTINPFPSHPLAKLALNPLDNIINNHSDPLTYERLLTAV